MPTNFVFVILASCSLRQSRARQQPYLLICFCQLKTLVSKRGAGSLLTGLPVIESPKGMILTVASCAWLQAVMASIRARGNIDIMRCMILKLETDIETKLN